MSPKVTTMVSNLAVMGPRSVIQRIPQCGTRLEIVNIPKHVLIEFKEALHIPGGAQETLGELGEGIAGFHDVLTHDLGRRHHGHGCGLRWTWSGRSNRDEESAGRK